jgi:preprotein translocase subunit Sec63
MNSHRHTDRTSLVLVESSLSDPVTVENYRKWGHPDGRQEPSLGIALSITIVNNEKLSAFVAILYTTLLVVAIPWYVRVWWCRLKTTDGLYMSSADRLFVASNHSRRIAPSAVDARCDVIRLISGRREIVEAVESYRKNKEPEMLEGLSGILAQSGRNFRVKPRKCIPVQPFPRI